MERLIFSVVLGCTLMAAGEVRAAGTLEQNAFAQLNKTAVLLGLQQPPKAPAASAVCRTAAGSWDSCPAMRNWVVPGDVWEYLMDPSSRSKHPNGRPPRAILRLANYYSANFIVKDKVRQYCNGREDAFCAVASEPESKAVYEGGKIQVVGADKVAEINDWRLADSVEVALAKNRVRLPFGGASGAVGCAMNDDCWSGLGEALNAYSDWIVASKAAAKKKAAPKDGEKDEAAG